MDNHGTILRVDLTTETITKEPISEELRRKYIGGEGIGARLLWEHFLKVGPNVDPVGPDNVLIISTGPFTGTGFGAGSKMKFTYKSPIYNMYGDTSAGAVLGCQLRWAGYDHIVITGKAKKPVYLWVNDDTVQIRDAARIWGKTVEEADALIKEELGDPQIETAGIGQAGENLVRYACVTVGCHRAGGRGGGGCVFGSKNLKMVAARGTKGIRIHDPKAFFQTVDDFLKCRTRLTEEPKMRYGTLVNVRKFQLFGFNAYRNHQGYLMPEEGVSKIDHNWYSENIGVRSNACAPGCFYGCGSYYQVKGDETASAKRYAGEWATRPEYGGINPFGLGCDIRDLTAAGHLNKMCNQYSMDTMEAGMGIAFLMELWERRIITPEDVTEWAGEPLNLEWGNYESAENILDSIAFQKNTLGKILAGGVYRAALKISELKGTDVLKYALYGKGGATHECQGARVWPNLVIAMAVCPIGGHHLKALEAGCHYALANLGTDGAPDVLGTNLKGAGHAVGENIVAISNSMLFCSSMIGMVPGVPEDLVSRAFYAITGISMTADELFKAGERVVNIEKAFNSRLGLRREHDTLCDRWLNQPMMEGATKGRKAGDFLEELKDEYYKRRGWDNATCLQTRKKLEELNMLDVAQVLEKENALA